MPIEELVSSNIKRVLTPSNTNTVELRQSADSLVSAIAKCVMNSMRTLLSVLHVVSAIQTSPSEDIAVMMLTFWLRALSGAVLRKPRRFHLF